MKVNAAEFERTFRRVRVVCDRHRRPWVVADYLRGPSGRWTLDATNPEAWRAEALGTPARHLVRLTPDDDTPTTAPPPTAAGRLQPEPRAVYPNACSFRGCRANTPLLPETLARVLDGLVLLGRDTVTLRELAEHAGRRR